MKTGLRLLTISLLLMITLGVNAQDDKKLTKNEAKTVLEKAELNFDEKNYIEALDQFTQLYNYKPSDLYYKLMMGICYTYDPAQKHKSIEIIEQVKITNPEYNLCNFYLGKAYAVNYEFDKAVNLFNMFLTSATQEDAAQKGLAAQMIENCKNAKEILADTISQNIVENVKYPINSQYSEYVPVISADESVMIYTYRGIKSKGAENIEKSMGSEAYMEDVFISYKKNGDWTEPVSIGDNINSDKHDAAIALSVDGQTLFIYKTDGGGDIYVSHLNGENWTKPEKVKGDVNQKNSWEGSCSLSANGKTLYFASDKDGGLGGRDIYKAALQNDGTWGDVENLGPNINTAYNDDAPFIHPDNRSLYFSSEGHSSIGGYDIFSSVKDENESGTFGEAKNLGYPINTIDDNRYFVLAADGKTGYYSGGGEESIGEQDIFKITTGKIDKPVLALLLGKVYFNDVPTGSLMNLFKQLEGELEGTFVSNAESGKYVMALTPGIYEIQVELETGEIVSDSVRLDQITEYVVLHKDFRIYSDSNLIVKNDPSLEALLAAELKKEGKTIDTLFTANIDAEIELKPMDEGRTFTLDNIEYDFDKSTLRSASKKELDRLVVILNEQKDIKVEISSHTDAKRNVEMAKRAFKQRGQTYTTEAHDAMSKKYNNRLSQRRANSVTNYLIKKGIAKSRLVAKGYGEEKPIATNATDDGRQKNRRTEFKVLESK
jgi:outer membrane protein OmpA-like peptidoglycan-associated protein/tetratricopeptide (TPR) repeat protein